MKFTRTLLAILLITLYVFAHSQPVPAKNENIPFLVTFGKNAPKSWGDDDHNQIIFFSVPEESISRTLIFCVWHSRISGEREINNNIASRRFFYPLFIYDLLALPISIVMHQSCYFENVNWSHIK